MAKNKKVEVEATNERKFSAPSLKALDVIIAPIFNEKTIALQREQNKVTVKVAPKANKTEIKIAFESIFNVKVVAVNIINVRQHEKRVGRYTGMTNKYKKAIVTLAEGQSIEI